jgi:hypothetical protein
MGLTPLHREYELVYPRLELLTQSKSLVVLLRDEKDVHLKIEFQQFCAYRSADETYSLDMTSPLAGPRTEYHWLYETEDSEFLRQFRERNPHTGPNLDVKHFLIPTLDSIIDVIAAEPPVVSPCEEPN